MRKELTIVLKSALNLAPKWLFWTEMTSPNVELNRTGLITVKILNTDNQAKYPNN